MGYPYEFRKSHGVWQRRRTGRNPGPWLTLHVVRPDPTTTPRRRAGDTLNEWNWT